MVTVAHFLDGTHVEIDCDVWEVRGPVVIFGPVVIPMVLLRMWQTVDPHIDDEPAAT